MLFTAQGAHHPMRVNQEDMHELKIDRGDTQFRLTRYREGLLLIREDQPRHGSSREATLISRDPMAMITVMLGSRLPSEETERRFITSRTQFEKLNPLRDAALNRHEQQQLEAFLEQVFPEETP